MVDNARQEGEMTVIGVDVGRAGHVAALWRSGSSEPEQKVKRIAARRSGLDELDSWMDRCGDVSLVVMEASGHYWMPLASHLKRQGRAVAVVNPLGAKYFAKSRLQRTKSDPADARTLAALGMTTRPRQDDPLAGAELREAARFAMTLIKEQGQCCQRLQRLVDLVFPELNEAFEDPSCDSGLAVLRLAPTASIAQRKHVTTLATAKAPDGKRSIGRKRAAEIKRLVQRSVAIPELEEQGAFEIQLLIRQYDLLKGQIEAAEERVASLLDDEVARRLQSIPGVGPAIAATLMAEIGDIWRFDDVDQLLAYAGVHPREASSGRKGSNPETSWRMAKTGNPHLRAALFRMAVVGTRCNPVIQRHYQRKREAGKTKMNAIGHCMSKCLRLVWGVWRGDRDFDPSMP